MVVDLTPEAQRLIERRLSSGAFSSIEEVIHAALASQDAESEWLLENREFIHEQIAEGLAELDRGEGVTGECARAELNRRKAEWLAENTIHK